MPTTLCRFEKCHADFVQIAITEVRAGRPVSAWTTHLLPQVVGLPHRSPNEQYVVRSAHEAEEYLSSRTLFLGYSAIADALHAQLVVAGVPIVEVFPPPDDLALIASLTLVGVACRRLGGPAFQRLAETCDSVLQVAGRQGYQPCPTTLDFMGVVTWPRC